MPLEKIVTSGLVRGDGVRLRYDDVDVIQTLKGYDRQIAKAEEQVAAIEEQRRVFLRSLPRDQQSRVTKP